MTTTTTTTTTTKNPGTKNSSSNVATTTTGTGGGGGGRGTTTATAAAASALGLVAVLGGLQLPFLFVKQAPFMATPGRKVRSALDFLLRRRRHRHRGGGGELSKTSSSKTTTSKKPTSKPPPVFVDLGSGDGQAVLEAARLGYRSIGIEFNWTLWALSRFRRRFFWPDDARRRSELLLGDYTARDLGEADVVMVFGVPRIMPALGRKIQRECSDGTHVMSYRFEMPLAAEKAESESESNTTNTTRTTIGAAGSDRDGDWDEDDDDDEEAGPRLRARCVYDEEEMRIYRKGDEEEADEDVRGSNDDRSTRRDATR